MKHPAGELELREMTDDERAAYAAKKLEQAKRAPRGWPSNRIRKRVLELSSLVKKRDGSLPVVYRGSGPWLEWQDWRKQHGISNAFFDSQECYTVPTELPPIDIDRVIREFGSGSLKDKLKT